MWRAHIRQISMQPIFVSLHIKKAACSVQKKILNKYISDYWRNLVWIAKRDEPSSSAVEAETALGLDLWILPACASTYILPQSTSIKAAIGRRMLMQRKGEGGSLCVPEHTESRRQTVLINLACVGLSNQSQVRSRHPKHWLLRNEGRGIRICRLPPGWRGGWQRAPTRWQHVAKLQSCQTVNVSMTTNCSTVVRGADEPTNQRKSVALRKPRAASLGGEHPVDN